MTVRNITGNIKDLAGNLRPETAFDLIPMQWGFGDAADTVVLGDIRTIASDGSGNVDFDAEEGIYALRFETRDGRKSIPMTVDSEGPWNIGRLIRLAGAIINDPILEAALQAVDDAQAWAESDTAPGDPGTKSAKTWAGESEASADDAAVSAQEAADSAASINPTNFLAKADNLSGLVDTGAARANLGLGTAATYNTGDFATAAQGELADTSLQLDDIGAAISDVVALEDVGGIAGLPAVDGSQLTGISVSSPVKAWVNFNGTGTVAIRDSLNVTSITDNGVGSFIVNFTDDFADTDYMAIASCQAQASQDSHIINIHNTNNTSAAVERAPLVGSMAVSICSRGNVAKDSAYVSVMVIGG